MIVFTCCGVLSCFGDSVSRVSVRADEQVVEGLVIYLKGHVDIRTSKIRIRAKEAEFNTGTGQVEARGAVSATKIGDTSQKPHAPLSAVRMNVNKPEQVTLVLSASGEVPGTPSVIR